MSLSLLSTMNLQNPITEQAIAMIENIDAGETVKVFLFIHYYNAVMNKDLPYKKPDKATATKLLQELRDTIKAETENMRLYQKEYSKAQWAKKVAKKLQKTVQDTNNA